MESKPPKINFICSFDDPKERTDGVPHWKLYLDDVWKGDFIDLEAAIKHIYSLTGREIWGKSLTGNKT